jgi:hypothetical protein
MPICVPASHTGTQNNQSLVATSFSALSRRSGQQLGFIGQGETAVRSRPIHRLSRQPARDCIGPRQPHQQNASEDWNLTATKGGDALLRRGGKGLWHRPQKWVLELFRHRGVSSKRCIACRPTGSRSHQQEIVVSLMQDPAQV